MKENYVVIDTKSKQHLLKVGDVFRTHTLLVGEIKVLLFKNKNDTLIGEPELKDIGVKLERVSDKKIKTDVRRYKSKSRYRKNKSHSDLYSFFKVLDFGTTIKNEIVEREVVEEKEVVKKTRKSIAEKNKKTSK